MATSIKAGDELVWCNSTTELYGSNCEDVTVIGITEDGAVEVAYGHNQPNTKTFDAGPEQLSSPLTSFGGFKVGYQAVSLDSLRK